MVAIAVVAGYVLGGLDRRQQYAENRSGWPPPTVGVGGANTNELTVAELQKLANARSEAIRSKDRTGFLAPLAANAKLRAGQTRLFDNLQKVNFAQAGYRPIWHEGRAADSFGRAITVSFDVSFVHQLAGYDPLPVTEWYRWTVTKPHRTAQPVITAVTGAPAPGLGFSKTVFWPAPWDRWADMRVVKGKRVVLLVDAPMAATARRWLPAADAAAEANLAAWRKAGAPGATFETFVASIVPTKREMDALYQVADQTQDAAGWAMPMVDHGHPERPEPTGVRVVVDANSSFFRDGTVAELWRHEFAHALIAGMNVNKTDPDNGLSGQDLWIVEGFAEYLANHGGPAQTRATTARADVAAGRTIRLAKAELLAVADRRQTDLDYWSGHQAMRYLAAKYGPTAPYRLVSAYYRAGKRDTALAEVGAPPYASFAPAAIAYARSQLR
ncbi:hypothetical protein [Pilimelia anulata]|uniref:hypothetical protein n=1 Tax=Pilimelia anulata TaxID=53371 RepID=UPI00166CFEA9|nr:hypothetical protein [Pilimelia anulata]